MYKNFTRVERTSVYRILDKFGNSFLFKIIPSSKNGQEIFRNTIESKKKGVGQQRFADCSTPPYLFDKGGVDQI